MGDDSTKQILTRNAIKNFILRIDLLKNESLNIDKIAESISQYFDRTEKRQISNYEISFTKGASELVAKEAFEWVLVSETASMTFSAPQNSFWLQSTQYKDNSIYKDIINKTVKTIQAVSSETESKRIGLRYINEFKCDKIKDISSIYGKRFSSIIKPMLNGEKQSRAIVVEEYNDDGDKLRLQYGILNKFYPSVISVFDLLLDLDSYIERTCNVTEWENVIAELNHTAYEKFITEINPKFLKELK